jgi:hypothetical protein
MMRGRTNEGDRNGKWGKGEGDKGAVLQFMLQIKVCTIDFLKGMLLISYKVLGVCFILLDYETVYPPSFYSLQQHICMS